VTVAHETDRDDQALALMRRAHELIPRGEWEGASAALEQAAALHEAAGRAYDRARCLQLAATLRRSAGDAVNARLLADRAATAAPQDQQLAISIAAEQAETAFAESRYRDAVSAWSRAIGQAREAGLKADGLSAMLRRRAAARVSAGEVEPALRDYDEAFRLLESSRGRETAGFVRTEQADLLFQYGHADHAALVLDAIDAGSGPHLLAEMSVMRARLARAAGRIDDAIECASRAREAALEAIAPVSYFAASVELAEGYAARLDRTNSYGALATAWATLSDVLGEGVARSWVEPVLICYQIQWGEQAFLEAKRNYEARRRAARDAKAE